MTDKDTVTKTLIPEWVEKVEKELESPKQTVIPALMAQKFQEYHTMAMAHAITKKEHEGMMYLNFFVIWKNKLWKAEFDGWGKYLDDVESQPYGPCRSDVNHKVGDISKLWHEGVSVKNIIKAIGAHPMATHHLLELPAEKRKGSINDIIEMQFDETVSSRESARIVRDMAGQPTIYCDQAVYDTVNEQYLFNVVIDPPEGDKIERDFTIPMVSPDVAEWLNRKLQPHQRVEK